MVYTVIRKERFVFTWDDGVLTHEPRPKNPRQIGSCKMVNRSGLMMSPKVIHTICKFSRVPYGKIHKKFGLPLANIHYSMDWARRWEASEAKKILEEDYASRKLPFDAKKLSAKDAWQKLYRIRKEFDGMTYNFFSAQLKVLRKKWKEKSIEEWTEKWEMSKAKALLEEDLKLELLPVDVKELSVKDAWEVRYEFRDEFDNMDYGFFGNKLRQLRNQWKRKDAVDWRNSPARLVLLYDLEDEILTTDENELCAKDAWDFTYSKMEEFEGVPFWQFEEKLKDHRKQFEELSIRSLREEIAMKQDMLLTPVKWKNDRGELRFCMTEARDLLRQDIKNGMQKGLTPAELQETRTAYHPFKARKFKEHIYQEIRYQKFVNYLEDKRVNKLKEAKEKRAKELEAKKSTKGKKKKQEKQERKRKRE